MLNQKQLMELGKKYGFEQNKLSEVMEKAKKYQPNLQGIVQAAKEHGGVNLVDDALKKANSPLISLGLRAMGIDTNKINKVGEEVRKMLTGSSSVTNNNNNQSPQNISNDKITDTNDLLERLKNLK